VSQSSKTCVNPACGRLPTTEQLLVEGGDARIALDPLTGLNKYGCQPFPDPHLLAFGSSTASVISTAGFAAANRLRQKLELETCAEPDEVVYAREIQRIRSELLQLCELTDVSGVEVVFATSGTELHLIAGQYAGSGAAVSALVVMVEADETGSGVAVALAGRQFDAGSAENGAGEGATIIGGSALEVVAVPIRLPDGAPRRLEDIDAEVEALVTGAVALGRRVLLILVDQSKTGLIAPSPACVSKLQLRLPDSVDVLVDACQFRIAPPTLRVYLEQGFMVALTGSKFVTGPSFSAALLLPPVVARRLGRRPVPPVLASCSLSANWPLNWDADGQLPRAANFGLLLRWEVALEELRKFRSVPQVAIENFLQDFAQAIRSRLMSDPLFEPLPVLPLDRRPVIEVEGWDRIQTIFPFLLYRPATHAGRTPLSREETARVYRQLQVDSTDNFASALAESNGERCGVRCQFGQPVACGTRDGVAVSALRICANARQISELTAEGGKGVAGVINDALRALDKTALLIASGY